jgi:hypothetical protein
MQRADEQVGHEARHKQACKHIKNRVVDLIGRNALGFALVVHVIHDHRADDARSRPGGE